MRAGQGTPLAEVPNPCYLRGMDLYVIQMDMTGAFKVGRSRNPKKRLQQLQTGCAHKLKLLLVAPNLGIQELGIHRDLQRYRLQGEWFKEEALAELPTHIYQLMDLTDPDWWKP